MITNTKLSIDFKHDYIKLWFGLNFSFLKSFIIAVFFSTAAVPSDLSPTCVGTGKIYVLKNDQRVELATGKTRSGERLFRQDSSQADADDVLWHALEAFKDILDALWHALEALKHIIDALQHVLEALKETLDALWHVFGDLGDILDTLQHALEALWNCLDTLKGVDEEKPNNSPRRSTKARTPLIQRHSTQGHKHHGHRSLQQKAFWILRSWLACIKRLCRLLNQRWILLNLQSPTEWVMQLELWALSFKWVFAVFHEKKLYCLLIRTWKLVSRPEILSLLI